MRSCPILLLPVCLYITYVYYSSVFAMVPISMVNEVTSMEGEEAASALLKLTFASGDLLRPPLKCATTGSIDIAAVRIYATTVFSEA